MFTKDDGRQNFGQRTEHALPQRHQQRHFGNVVLKKM